MQGLIRPLETDVDNNGGLLFSVFVQVEPHSLAAKDGRIKEGDRIVQVYV